MFCKLCQFVVVGGQFLVATVFLYEFISKVNMEEIEASGKTHRACTHCKRIKAYYCSQYISWLATFKKKHFSILSSKMILDIIDSQ